MRNTFKTIASLTVLGAFVILNWATSQELNYRELNAEAVIYQDTLIILRNLDDLNITEADLVLTNLESENFKQYFIGGYTLSSSSSDTLEMIEFVDENNIAYPDSIRPNSLSLNFYINDNTGDTIVSFNTDL